MLTGQVKRAYDREKGKAVRDQVTFLLRNYSIEISGKTVGSIMR